MSDTWNDVKAIEPGCFTILSLETGIVSGFVRKIDPDKKTLTLDAGGKPLVVTFTTPSTPDKPAKPKE